jgi:hypothetical protein
LLLVSVPEYGKFNFGQYSKLWVQVILSQGVSSSDKYFLLTFFLNSEIFDHNGNGIYRTHPPTCCGGCCVNICAEGNPCGKGCCKVPFHVFRFDDKDTNSSENNVGKILKKPKSLMTDIMTEADSFDVTFPQDATPARKGLLIGTAILFNALYFEGEQQ